MSSSHVHIARCKKLCTVLQARSGLMSGFKVNFMNMRDQASGKCLWERHDWSGLGDTILEAEIPKDILECKVVTREINFSTEKKMTDLKLKQSVLLHGQPIEVWLFDFGFVIPNSTNTWQQTIEAAGDMIPAEVLSGNLIIDTEMRNGDEVVHKSQVRIVYV